MENTTQKTVRQWFEGCENVSMRTRLLVNLVTEFSDRTTDSVGQPIDSLNKAIQCGFYWSTTTEGFDYWNTVTNYEFAPQFDFVEK